MAEDGDDSWSSQNLQKAVKALNMSLFSHTSHSKVHTQKNEVMFIEANLLSSLVTYHIRGRSTTSHQCTYSLLCDASGLSTHRGA